MAFATLQIDSDWATFQLATSDASLVPSQGVTYPPDVIFTPNGVLVGQPNKGLLPQTRTIEIQIIANDKTVDFFTGHGNDSTSSGVNGSIGVILASIQYKNSDITGDGLNIKTFHGAPLYK